MTQTNQVHAVPGNDAVLGISMTDWEKSFPLIRKIRHFEEVFWLNGQLKPVAEALAETGITMAQIQSAESRLKRFADFFTEAFPETRATQGLIESPLRRVEAFQKALEGTLYEIPFGRLMLKLDSHLPISGSIKARGGIYEVLQHAERLAAEAGLIQPGESYAAFADEKLRTFFSEYRVAVGSTGNLGLSIGIISAALGFKAQVHMSADAKAWKKDLLRQKGVEVIEYDSDYSVAVEHGRKAAEEDPKTYFIDDENSIHLFLGYAVAALRLKTQMDALGFTPSRESPLFVYLPCGVGGGPGGVAFGLKMVFGEHVHCYFAEPTHSPCMLLGMMTDRHDAVSVQDFGLDNRTIADGLAVGRPSLFVGRVLKHLIDGIFSVSDVHMLTDLAQMAGLESLRLEPSALAGISGPSWLKRDSTAYEAITQLYSKDALSRAIHLSWATGGSMVPEDVMDKDIENGRKMLKLITVSDSRKSFGSIPSMQIVLDEGIGRSDVGLKQDEETLGKLLWSFNLASWPVSDPPIHPVRLFLRTAEGSLLGGLNGKVYRGALFVDQLFVDESLRGQGWGSRLLERAEILARGRGAVFAHLDTFSFQAPDFYEKHGYVIFGVLDDYPDGLKRYFYKKKL
jgi:D-serine dehydratase